MKPSNKYDLVEWENLVAYSEYSPSGLVWIVNRGTKIKPGMTVGHIQRIKGRDYEYWTFRHGDKMYNVHRVVYKLVGLNYNPGLVVDHIDRNPLNNRIENLRMISHELNTRNRVKLKANKSGITGVIRKVSRNTFHWVAYITIGQTMRTKSFSEAKYGEILAKQLAVAWRDEVFKSAVKNSGFTDHHGKD